MRPYKVWLGEVIDELLKYGFTSDEAKSLIDWKIYYLQGYEPWDAARQPLTHWE